MNIILAKLFSKPKQKNMHENVYHFEAIMEAATKMSRIDPNQLPKLIKLIARKIQANAMSAALYYKTRDEINKNVPHLYPNNLLFDYSIPLNAHSQNLLDFQVKIEYSRKLELKTDVFLPWPWSRDGIIGNLCGIEVGTWRQDLNHQIEYWLPIGIGFVNGGNHSIMCGITNGEGTISDYYAYDISEIYKHVYCDGLSYLRKSDSSIISEVNNLEFAAIFEIGRLMVKHGVSA